MNVSTILASLITKHDSSIFFQVQWPFQPFSAQIEKVDELENTLIHYLCVGSMTHSKILELIRSVGKQEATVDEILMKIADYTSCTKEPTKKVYKLKKG